jgi:DNA-binding LacI/PurR family transcriptional regulator
MMTLADQCGVSRMPVQQAIERLGEEGYVRQENRSGVYLASMMPEGREPLGTIGIVLLSDPRDEREMEFLAYEQVLVHRFIRQAEQRNYQTKVIYTNSTDNWGELTRRSTRFGDAVKGIISLIPFPRAEAEVLSGECLPLVFWCEPDHRCSPCVTSDYEAAFYRLTARTLQEGHRRIAIVPCPILTPYVHECFLRGYRRALADAGLPPVDDLITSAEKISLRDTAGLLPLVTAHQRTTAFVCMSLHRAEQVISTLTIADRRVPDDASVLGTNPPSQPLPTGHKLTGVGFSSDNEIELCIEMLREQMLNKKWRCSTLMVAPFLVEGDTVAPPKK